MPIPPPSSTASRSTLTEGRRGGRPSKAEAAGIEGQIVDVARDLFFAHGYGATSIEMIARRAGISKRTFYARFENKAAIFREVVNRLVAGVMPHDVGVLFEGQDCGEILHGLALALIEASLSPQTLALHRMILAEATRFPELALVMTQQGARRDGIRRIGELLQHEADAGRLQAGDPAKRAELFMQMVIGLPQRRAMGLGAPMTPEELKAWAHEAVELFMNGCRLRP